MSSKVSILEGQLERNFGGVKLLRTDLASGGSCEWIPEDDVQLTTLNISKNGTYKASDHEDSHGNKYYGFSQVTVNVTGRTTIVDPEDGNEYSVETDEETGELKKTVLPSSIDVVGLPTKTTYRDGDPINKSGMVVKAYLADGTLYDYKYYQFGGIPLSELEIEPTKAEMQGGGELIYEKDGVKAIALMCDTYRAGAYITGYSYANPVNINPSSQAPYRFIKRKNTPGIIYYTKYKVNDGVYVYGTTPDGAETSSYISTNPKGETGYGAGPSYVSSHANQFSDIIRGGEDYFNQIADKIPLSDVPPWTVDFSGAKAKDSKQTITVKWKRPEDGKELTDTFEITVIPANTSGGESGEGNTGEGNTTSGGGGSW